MLNSWWTWFYMAFKMWGSRIIKLGHLVRAIAWKSLQKRDHKTSWPRESVFCCFIMGELFCGRQSWSERSPYFLRLVLPFCFSLAVAHHFRLTASVWYGFGPVCGMLTGSVTLFLCLLVFQVQRDSGWSLTGSAPPKGAMTLSQLWMVSTGLSPCGQVGRGVELAFVETISTLLLHSHVRLHERTISDLTAKYSRFYLFAPCAFSKMIYSSDACTSPPMGGTTGVQYDCRSLLGALVVGRAQPHLDSGDGAVRCLGLSDSCTVKVDILQGFLKVLFFNWLLWGVRLPSE